MRQLSESMLIRFFALTFMSWVLIGAVMAGSIEATNKQPSLNTNPRIELYPGQQEDIDALMVSARVTNVRRLIEMLTSLRNNEPEKVIMMLEAELETESKLLRHLSRTSKEAEEAMNQITKYKKLVGAEPAHNKSLKSGTPQSGAP